MMVQKQQSVIKSTQREDKGKGEDK